MRKDIQGEVFRQGPQGQNILQNNQEILVEEMTYRAQSMPDMNDEKKDLEACTPTWDVGMQSNLQNSQECVEKMTYRAQTVSDLKTCNIDENGETLEACTPTLEEETYKACMPTWEEFCCKRGCYECVEEAKERMKIDCNECGEGINEDDIEMCILGLDVVGLFPAMKSKNSGRILRRQAVKGPLKVRGFKWKHGARYIRVNKHLTGDLSKVVKFRPH